MGLERKKKKYIYIYASPVTQKVKNLPAMWETSVRSLGQEDPLEKGTATHSSILDIYVSSDEWRSLSLPISLLIFAPEGN